VERLLAIAAAESDPSVGAEFRRMAEQLGRRIDRPRKIKIKPQSSLSRL
jgi:hypothetical protein